MIKKTIFLLIGCLLAFSLQLHATVIGHYGSTDPTTEGWTKQGEGTATGVTHLGEAAWEITDPDGGSVPSEWIHYDSIPDLSAFNDSNGYTVSWRLSGENLKTSSSDEIAIRVFDGKKAYMIRYWWNSVNQNIECFIYGYGSTELAVTIPQTVDRAFGWHDFDVSYDPYTDSYSFYYDDVFVKTFTPTYAIETTRLAWGGLGGNTDDSREVKSYWSSVELRTGQFANLQRAQDFGMQWVRSNPFNLMGLTQRPNAIADNIWYREVGFDTLLAFAGRTGLFENAHNIQQLPWHYYTGRGLLDETLISTITNYVENYPGCTGITTWDEPYRSDMFAIANVVDWIKYNYPDLLVYGNLYPAARNPDNNYGKHYGSEWLGPDLYADPPVPYSYEDYLNDYLNIVGPDILMVDTYPYKELPEGTTEESLYGQYFHTLQSTRNVATNANIPYWVYIQAFDYDGYVRCPSESDLRMQVFSSLAYGFTGITYFTYDPVFDGAMLKFGDTSETWYIKTVLYDYAFEINKEIRNLAQSLLYLTNTDTRYLIGQHLDEYSNVVDNTQPYNTTAFDVGDDSYITGISVTNPGSINNGLPWDILIGYLTPASEEFDGPSYSNEKYFMIVNLFQAEDINSTDTTQDITIDFDFGTSGISSLQRLRRDTGMLEEVALVHLGDTNYRLVLSLSGGTGDLFKYNTGAPFVSGLEPLCGDISHPIPIADLNGDCRVNFYDFSLLASHWLESTVP